MKTMIGITRDLDSGKSVEVNFKIMRELGLSWGFNRIDSKKVNDLYIVKWAEEGFRAYGV